MSLQPLPPSLLGKDLSQKDNSLPKCAGTVSFMVIVLFMVIVSYVMVIEVDRQ